MTEKNKRDIGKEGEDLAAKYLAEKGFEIGDNFESQLDFFTKDGKYN